MTHCFISAWEAFVADEVCATLVHAGRLCMEAPADTTEWASLVPGKQRKLMHSFSPESCSSTAQRLSDLSDAAHAYDECAGSVVIEKAQVSCSELDVLFRIGCVVCWHVQLTSRLVLQQKVICQFEDANSETPGAACAP
jgi:hypothetical protein